MQKPGKHESTSAILSDVKPTTPNKANIAFSVLFAVLSANSLYTQILVSFRWFTKLPLVAVFILAKELFGLAISLKPGVKIFMDPPTDKPVSIVFNDPFDKKYGILANVAVPENMAQTVQTMTYVICSVSNARSVFANAIRARYNCSAPFFNQETILQKVGNIVVFTIELVVNTQNTKVEDLSSLIFLGLFRELALLLFSHFSTAAEIMRQANLVDDMMRGNLNEEEQKKAVEYMYKKQFGELIENGADDKKKKE